MEFLHIYIIVAVIIFAVVGIFIVNVIEKESVLDKKEKTFIEVYIDKKKKEIDRTRINISIEAFIALKAIIPGVLGFIAYFTMENKLMIIAMIPLGFIIPDALMSLKKNSEKKKFESRFVRALGQMASSLHSGMTIEQSIDSVIKCELLHPEIREDFMLLSSKMKLGSSISTVFYEYADISESKDVADVATAITIMTSIGGDAGVAVEKIQKNIEDRLLYRKKRNSMMTESKILTITCDVVPIIILVGSFIFMPDAMMSYIHDMDKMIILIVICGILFVGSVIIHKMLGNKIDVA